MNDDQSNNVPNKDTDIEATEAVESADTAEVQSADAADGVTEVSDVDMIGQFEDTRFGKMKHVSIVDEMEKSYLDYAMSVIVSRALPDVRDGLKPVHRRILFAMHSAGIHHSSSYKKSARIVGDVLGRYHPHGDAPVYGAMVRLAQDFSMRYQLVDGQGNFGSIDGDSPAAMRYTEARLAKITQELLVDINKNTVPFVDNFDGSMQEPTVLPAKLPNLLLMGSEGIAVGMATKIPPHNLNEVCKAIIATINAGKSELSEEALAAATKAETEIKSIDPDLSKATDKKAAAAIDPTLTKRIDAVLATSPENLAGQFSTDITIDEITEYVIGPDFPTAAIMYDHKEIKQGYHTGKGRVVIRAKAEIVEGKKGFQIIVTELPYQVNKARLLMKIAQLVRDKKITGIRDLNDDSDRTGLQMTIDLKRDARPKVVLNKLFKYTDLQTSFSMNMVALNSDGVPQLMNIKQIIREFIVHRQLVITRRSQYELSQARDRAHILEGLLIALSNLDDVIDTIRKSPDTDTARTRLMEKFGLSEVQASAILEMQLKRLAALERQKIEDEYKTIKVTIDALLKLLRNPSDLLAVIVTETEELMELYGDKRKTKLVKSKAGEFSEEDLVADEATMVVLTETGYIKRISPSAFRSQSRGGKGSIGMKVKEEDTVKSMLSATTHNTLLFFTNQGRVFKLKAYEIPESSRQAKGTAIVNLLNLKAEEIVQTMLIVDEKEDKDRFIVLVTKNGLIKKTAVKLFDNIRQNGIIAMTLNDDDQLIAGRLTNGDDYIMIVTHQGKSIKFSEKEVKASNRDTKGVKGITLSKEDFVVGSEAFPQSLEKPSDGRKKFFYQLLLVTENGLGKRTNLDEYPLQKRAGMGVKVASITKKTGLVASARLINHEHDEVIITTQSGQAIKLPVSKNSIPVLTRPTQGVILMRLKSSDRVVAVALTLKDADEDTTEDSK
jgi:DNA gyrase subunit A